MSKTIPPVCPEPETGRKYWRSLDQLADAPEFRQWVEREFPAGASEFTDPQSRRHFVKIMSASFLLGGLGLAGSGCRRPEEKILPFGKMPEGYLHGVPQYFATAFPTRGSAVPLVVKWHDGRPVKIEGNAQHPDSNGSTDIHAQASILGLYDPDRAQRFTRGGAAISREQGLDALDQVSKQFAPSGGEGLWFLLEQNSSPSRVRLQQVLTFKFPKARWVAYEPVDLNAGRQLTGSALYHKLDAAKVILSFDCDFIAGEDDSARHCTSFAKGRRVEKPGDSMNRLYTVEGLYTLTGFSSDHRLRVPTSQVVAVAALIAAEIAPNNEDIKALARKLTPPASVKREWVVECARDLQNNRGSSVVLAGHRQPLAVHILAHLINTALGNNGKTVFYSEIAQVRPTDDLKALAQALTGGQVDTLVVVGGNPALTAPADLDWAAAQAKAKTVVRLGYYEDETFAASPANTLHIPQAHYLESWGDARTSDGTLVPIQPLLAPLFNGLTEIEVLARLGSLEATRPYDIVRDTFRLYASNGNVEELWKKFLHDGFFATSAPKPNAAPLTPDRIAAAFAEVTAVEPSPTNLEVVFHRDYSVDDGRYSNNGWLQELPDPVTKVAWDSLVLVSRKTAELLGVANKSDRTEIVEIEFGGRKVRGPVWVQPGLSDNTVALALGYGRTKTAKGGTGRVATDVGLYNAYALRTSTTPSYGLGAKVKPTGETYLVACTQEHGSMEGRPIVREANADTFKEHPEFAKHMDLESHSDHIEKDPKTGLPLMIYEHPYVAYDQRKKQVGVDLSHQLLKSDVHQWGMSIDLGTCVGCSACVIACQSENNIPIVGKEQIWRNREMHWIRIDRYFSGSSDAETHKEQIDDPQAVLQPMLCQHCENAPCESVCPVNATVHDEEGLNVMAYNRCVGTRYCSNNCPYKVRRFNFFDYNRRSIDQLKGPFYPSGIASKTDGEWNLVRWWNNPDKGTRPEDEWELLKLVKNPDVSVRMRGVMEKCTFCVQRIEQAKIAQKVKAGPSGDVQVPEGTFKTACQQACPTEAIVFGNLLDPSSRVSQLKKQERDYAVIGFLDTRARVTYLARIRNPNPKMPDYQEIEVPKNINEYFAKQTGKPYEEHHAAAGHGTPEGAAHAEQKGAH